MVVWVRWDLFSLALLGKNRRNMYLGWTDGSEGPEGSWTLIVSATVAVGGEKHYLTVTMTKVLPNHDLTIIQYNILLM